MLDIEYISPQEYVSRGTWSFVYDDNSKIIVNCPTCGGSGIVVDTFDPMYPCEQACPDCL